MGYGLPDWCLDLTVVHVWFSLPRMKLAVLGAGGFRTPVVYRAIASGRTQTRYDELALYDVDSARLERIEAVIRGIDEAQQSSVPYRVTTSLEDAVDGADIVYCAIRVGGITGRLVDETVASRPARSGRRRRAQAGSALRSGPCLS